MEHFSWEYNSVHLRFSRIQESKHLSLTSDNSNRHRANTALQKALNDPNSAIQVAATGALGIIGKPALDILLSALDTENIALRLSVIQAIVSLNVLKGPEDDPKTIEDYDQIASLLSKIAEDETVDPYVRETAKTALTRMVASKVKMRH